MRRALVVCEFSTLNGGERSLLAVAPHLRSHGFAIEAVCPAEGPLAAALASVGVGVHPFACRDAHGRTRPRDELRAELGQRIAATRPDLLHANSLSMGRLCGPVARSLDLPGVAHLRDIVSLSAQAVADLNANSQLVAVSQATCDFHVAQRIDRQRIVVVYNGVDLERFQPRAPTGWLHERLGLPSDALLIGAVGQVILRKGHDVLLDAAATLLDRFPALHVVIAGARHSAKAETVAYEAALRRRAAEAPLAGRVHFLGTLSEVERLLPELALLVHPARQEPLGRVLLEAAAAGVAAVATAVGGTAEIFPPSSGAALLVEPGDPAALAAAVAQGQGDPRLRAALSAAARRRAVEAFDAAQSAANLAACWRCALDGRSPAP